MRQKRLLALVAGITLVFGSMACGGPDDAGLRDSFAAQLAANNLLKDVQRNGDEVTFTGAGADGGTAKWRVHIDASSIEPNEDPAKPDATYKGTVKSSWYSDGKIVQPSGSESHLPIELMANGLSQDCWAFWNKATKKWEWE
jgi:hypothetical protein